MGLIGSELPLPFQTHLCCFQPGQASPMLLKGPENFCFHPRSLEHMAVRLEKTDFCSPQSRLRQGCSHLCVHQNHMGCCFKCSRAGLAEADFTGLGWSLESRGINSNNSSHLLNICFIPGTVLVIL